MFLFEKIVEKLDVLYFIFSMLYVLGFKRMESVVLKVFPPKIKRFTAFFYNSENKLNSDIDPVLYSSWCWNSDFISIF